MKPLPYMSQECVEAAYEALFRVIRETKYTGKLTPQTEKMVVDASHPWLCEWGRRMRERDHSSP